MASGVGDTANEFSGGLDIFNSGKDEKSNEPSVDAIDINERIAARRFRIQRRLEILRRAGQVDEDDLRAKLEQELTRGEKQSEASRQRLEKLLRDGNELVSNIRVACDERENLRRREEEDIKRQRKDKLEAEAKAASERFEEITKKWELALQKDVPQELHELLLQQKQACDAMIDEKNKVINDLHAELKHKDDLYVRDIKKHADDIDLLVERMEEEARQVWKAMREELEEVERAYQLQRSELLEKQKSTWDRTMTARREKEKEYLEAMLKRIEENERQLHQLRVQDAEEYNAIKIQLEGEVQRFQQQLQQMKATYQLNQEKLEYNFQILKKRDEENTVTKSQQKRKITKLHDVLNALRLRMGKLEKQFKDENKKLVDDYKHVVEQLLDLQNKSKHFLEADMATFTDLWLLNEAEAKRLVRRILDIDRIVFEQQLGLRYQPPQTDLNFLANEGPIKAKKAGGGEMVRARDILVEVLARPEGATGGEVEGEAPVSEAGSSRGLGTEGEGDGSEAGASERTGGGESGRDLSARHRSKLLRKLSPDTIRRVLTNVCNESGFLVETKLWSLLKPLERNDQNLMKLDSIFHALGIETEEDIRKLVEYFVVVRRPTSVTPYGPMGVPTLEGGMAPEGEAMTSPSGQSGPSETERESEDRAASRPRPATRVLNATAGDGESNSGEPITGEQRGTAEGASDAASSVSGGAGRSIQDSNVDFVHPNDTLRVLLQFVEDNRHLVQRETKTELEKLRLLQEPHAHAFRLAHFEARDNSDDSAYWKAYTTFFPEAKLKTWSELESALDKYYQALHQRSDLQRETAGLRQQNSELKMLLHQYLNARVNRELQVPPTRVFGQAVQSSALALGIGAAALAGAAAGMGTSKAAPLPPIPVASMVGQK